LQRGGDNGTDIHDFDDELMKNPENVQNRRSEIEDVRAINQCGEH
jgi:hypothetical protein